MLLCRGIGIKMCDAAEDGNMSNVRLSFYEDCLAKLMKLAGLNDEEK